MFVDIFNQYKNPLFFFDVDLTLRDTMCLNTPLDQRRLMSEFYERTNGGIILMSGRSSESLDKTFDGHLPHSSEHHSAIRVEKNGEVVSLAPEIDTQKLSESVVELIGGRISLSDTPESIRQATGIQSLVFPEVKKYALALVHSLSHPQVEQDRSVLEQVAKDTIDLNGLSGTHKVAVGSDAIEIVPRGINVNSTANQILEPCEVDRLKVQGLNKGTAIHNFMSLKDNRDRTPIVVGDSGTDGVAMLAASEYGGAGVWVKNGKDVPEEFKSAVNGFQISDFNETWDHLGSAMQNLREDQRTYAVVEPSV